MSAQSLSRNRVDGLVFDVAGFTSFSRDHLDDYANMAEYLDGKLLLFTPEHARRAVVSLDSFSGAEVVAHSQIPTTTILTPAIAEDPTQAADWSVTLKDERADGTVFTLAGPYGELTTKVPLLGAHMAANAGLAIVMMLVGGYSWDDLKRTLEGEGQLRATAPGRTQLVSGSNGPAV